jgi:hypothetical protein
VQKVCFEQNAGFPYKESEMESLSRAVRRPGRTT